MMESPVSISTGLKGIDAVVNGLRKGDNVVWQVDSIEDYRYFVTPYVENALKNRKRVVYIRFARHEPLLEDNGKVAVYQLEAQQGFELFSTKIHNIITQEGLGAYYVFDCLSDLLFAWATDLMIGNFFVVTCPYLFELDTFTYFALLRSRHSHKTIARIRETTQLMIDVHNCAGNLYVHPLKVWNRYSPTMFLPHVRQGEEFIPITNSFDVTNLYTHICKIGTEIGIRRLDYWDQIFIEAESMAAGPASPDGMEKMVDQICRIMLTKDERMLGLIENNFTLEELLLIKSRLVGTGFIGGKSVGMLLARNILQRDSSFDWEGSLEPHDSFFIGSDVFYTYIVQNGWWKLLMEQKTESGYFEMAALLREKMLKGRFPDEIKEQFYNIIEYYGQSPIIIRSSSLLEDSFGNAFAGKYESVFSVNQGSPDERYAQFEAAIKRIFASAMNEDALTYRLQRGLNQLDEQMALLVQRVSGAHHKSSFFPDAAGVGVSYNTFVWKDTMDPRAGMIRLVFGLGTRAVNRVEGDYPRIVALDVPLLRPHEGMRDTRRFSQKEVDLLNTAGNRLETVSLQEIVDQKLDVRLDLFAAKDEESVQKMRELGMKEKDIRVLTFDPLLSESSFVSTMKRLLKTLENAYQYPVEIEFTANFKRDTDDFQINLLQCRPFQTKGEQRKRVDMPHDISDGSVLFRSEGNFMGGSISQYIKRIIFVDPKRYTELNQSQKYDIARLIGRLNRQIGSREKVPALIAGPGRWGTTTPSLGVPVSFSEINNVTVMVEISFTEGHLMPELSFGTHFFHDLVETDIYYIALFPENRSSCFFNREMLEGLQNGLEELLPEHTKYKDVVKVHDFEGKGLHLLSDLVSQRVMCFLEHA